MTNEFLTPAAMAAACDVSVDTLRYYEREGLLEDISRTGGGQRQYSSSDVAWVQVLRCLRATAMPIREMRAFAMLVREGETAMADRLELLANHRKRIVDQVAVLHEALELVDHKIEAYTAVLAETPKVDKTGPAHNPTLDGKGIRAS